MQRRTAATPSRAAGHEAQLVSRCTPVVQTLKQEIERRLSRRSQLPPEGELQQRFKVSRQADPRGVAGAARGRPRRVATGLRHHCCVRLPVHVR
jgi:hypothetical protein